MQIVYTSQPQKLILYSTNVQANTAAAVYTTIQQSGNFAANYQKLIVRAVGYVDITTTNGGDAANATMQILKDAVQIGADYKVGQADNTAVGHGVPMQVGFACEQVLVGGTDYVIGATINLKVQGKVVVAGGGAGTIYVNCFVVEGVA